MKQQRQFNEFLTETKADSKWSHLKHSTKMRSYGPNTITGTSLYVMEILCVQQDGFYADLQKTEDARLRKHYFVLKRYKVEPLG